MPTNKEILDLMERAVSSGNMDAARELRDMYQARRGPTAEPTPAAAPEQTTTYTPPVPQEDLPWGMTWPGEQVVAPEQGDAPGPAAEAPGFLEQGVRSLLSGGSRLARGFAETQLAAEEAFPIIAKATPTGMVRMLGDVVPSLAGEPSATERLHEAWKAEESKIWTPYASFQDVLDDPTKAPGFVLDMGINSIPTLVTAYHSLPAAIATRVGGNARERARNRGDDKVSVPDMAIATAFGLVEAAIEKAGGRAAIASGAGTTPLRRIGTTLAVDPPAEALQEAVETVGTQIGTREEGILGVDPKDVAMSAGGGALAGLGTGAIVRGATEATGIARRAMRPPADPTPEAPPTVIVEPEGAPWVETDENAYDSDARMERLLSRAPEQVVAEEAPTPTEAVVAEERGPLPLEPGSDMWREWVKYAGLDPMGHLKQELVTEEVVEEPVGPPFGPEGSLEAERSLEEYRRALDGRDPDPAEDIRTIEAILQRPGAGSWLGTMRNMALGRLEGDPFSERLRYGANRAEELWQQRRAQTTPEPEVITEAVVAEEVVTPTEEVVEGVVEETGAPKDTVPVDAVDAIIESIDESTAPGEFTQVAPKPLPMDAGPEVEAIDVMMETHGLVEKIDALKSRVKAEGRAARRAVPKRAGAKEVKRKPTRVENKIAEAEGRARAALAVADVTAADSDIDDALADAVAAQARTLAGPSEFISAKDADVESLLRDMGRSDEDIKALSETKRVSYAQSLARLDDAGLRSRIEGDGQDLAVVIPPAMTALANSINQRPRAASDVEQLAFASVIAQVNTANRRLSARINELDQIVPESSVEKSAIQDEIDILTKKKEGLDADFDLFVAANKAIGSIWGRAGWMRQRRINDNMTLDEAQGAARAKKGAPLTPKQKDLLESIFNDADALRDAATKARKGALGDYNKAKRALEKAQGVKKSADEVRNAARKKVEKAMDKRSPRQKAAEEEIRWGVDKPIRVTPLRMSAEEKAARKAFRNAQKKAKQAAREVAKKEKKAQEIKGMVAQAEADIRRAKQKKATAPEEAIQHPFFRHWTRQKSIARAMTSSGDDSALGRQGGALFFQNPAAAIRTLPYIVRVNPFKWDPVSRRVVHNPASRAAAIEIQEEMLNSPWQTARNWAGLEMSEVEGRSNTDKSGLDAKEEYFATHAFDEGGKLLQGAGKYLITPSQNLFSLTLNRLRSVNFDEGLRILAEGEGADLDAVTPEAGDAVITAMIEANAPPSKPRRLRKSDEDLFLTKEDIVSLTPDERAAFGRIDLAMNVVPRADAEALAVIINASSGRGEWTFGVSDRKGVDVVNKVLRNILFAPKFTASRFESFSHPFQLIAASRGHGRFKNVSPKALKLFRKRVGRSIGLGVGLGAMSVIAASFDDDRDPEEALDNFMNPGSADFLKGRIGNHRFDALGGIPTSVRYLLPLNFTPMEAWRKSDDPAEWAYHTLISDWGEGAGDKFSRMVRNKLDPLTSAAWTILTQKDYLGRPLREQDFMGMPASEMSEVESFIINGLIRPVIGAYSPITAQSASEAAIRTMYPHIGEEERNAFVHQFAPLLWEALGGGHADYPDIKGSRGYKARSRRSKKRPKYTSPRY